MVAQTSTSSATTSARTYAAPAVTTLIFLYLVGIATCTATARRHYDDENHITGFSPNNVFVSGIQWPDIYDQFSSASGDQWPGIQDEFSHIAHSGDQWPGPRTYPPGMYPGFPQNNLILGDQWPGDHAVFDTNPASELSSAVGDQWPDNRDETSYGSDFIDPCPNFDKFSGDNSTDSDSIDPWPCFDKFSGDQWSGGCIYNFTNGITRDVPLLPSDQRPAKRRARRRSFVSFSAVALLLLPFTTTHAVQVDQPARATHSRFRRTRPWGGMSTWTAAPVFALIASTVITSAAAMDAGEAQLRLPIYTGISTDFNQSLQAFMAFLEVSLEHTCEGISDIDPTLWYAIGSAPFVALTQARQARFRAAARKTAAYVALALRSHGAAAARAVAAAIPDRHDGAAIVIALHARFGQRRDRASVLLLERDLRNLELGSMTISEYGSQLLMRMQRLADAGAPVADDTALGIYCEGLPTKFKDRAYDWIRQNTLDPTPLTSLLAEFEQRFADRRGEEETTMAALHVREPKQPATSGEYTGLVVHWNSDRGFGFIKPNDGGDDVFCHVSAITDGNTLTEGKEVTYDVAYDDRRNEDRAQNVMGGFWGARPRHSGRGGSRGSDGATSTSDDEDTDHKADYTYFAYAMDDAVT